MSVHQTALDKAKIALMATPESAFFTSVCFSLKHKWDDSISTACTNGTEIRYNTDFFLDLTPDEQLFLLLHETLHVALQHMTRLGGRDPRKWNIAADYVINYILIQYGFKMPEGGLYDAQYAGMSTEEVYDALPDDPQEELPMEDIELPGDGETTDSEGKTSPGGATAIQKTQEQIDDMLVRAALQAQIAGDGAGTIPGQIQLYINSLLRPKLPWHRILKRWMTKLTKSDYTWRKPKRRFFPKYHLPSQYSTSLCDIAVAVDISASVSDAQFHQFVSEVYAILKREKPTTLKLIQFDTHIRGITDIHSPKDLMNVKFTGRGGTNITEIVQWARDNNPHLLIVFTDGGFRNNETAPKSPMVWVINDNPNYTAPWGKTIHFETQ